MSSVKQHSRTRLNHLASVEITALLVELMARELFGPNWPQVLPACCAVAVAAVGRCACARESCMHAGVFLGAGGKLCMCGAGLSRPRNSE